MTEEPQRVRGHEFAVGPRYNVLEFIGEGAYGIVVKATDKQGDPNDNLGKYFPNPRFFKFLFFGKNS